MYPFSSHDRRRGRWHARLAASAAAVALALSAGAARAETTGRPAPYFTPAVARLVAAADHFPVSGVAAPAVASRPPASRGLAADQFTAQIRYTTGGIPHILAHNWADLGFGYGYAFAKDNICTMANDYVTVEAQRSRYFGPKGSYLDRGGLENNLESDI